MENRGMYPKVIHPKGTILEWVDNLTGFDVKKGAKVELVEDYTTNCEFVRVKFLDDLSNGQNDGGYHINKFKCCPNINNALDKLMESIDILECTIREIGIEVEMLKQLSKEDRNSRV